MGIFNTFIGNGKPRAAGDPRGIDLERSAAALDRVESCVMLADAANNIVKINQSCQRMLRAAEADLREALPGFSVDALVGRDINLFEKAGDGGMGLAAVPGDGRGVRMRIGPRTFSLNVNPLFGADNARTGSLVEWRDLTQELAGEEERARRLDDGARAACELVRVKTALDKASTHILVADEKNVIVYANEAMSRMLGKVEAEIRKQQPHFNAGKVIGGGLDVLHRNSGCQNGTIAALKTPWQGRMEVGGKTFDLILHPIFDGNGDKKGTAVEWKDRTEEMALEKTVGESIAKAVRGEIDGRIDDGELQGFRASIAQGINELMDVFTNVIKDVEQSLAAMAAGDLTRKIDNDYQGLYGRLKRNFNATVDKLREVMTAMRESTVLLKNGAGEIAAGNANLSQRTEEQAASLEETSAAMEEITTTVQQNAANSAQANTLARSARETAENGGAVVGKAVSAMLAISESSKKIADIIGVIDEIAFQTNLLSLNAAVEAARAGEQGRGFAVVADEVRGLAGRSATAAKEIKELIKDSVAKVEEGADLVNKSGATLEDIVTAVKKVNDIVAEISTASEEQATGLDEINRAVGGMDEMTQQNSALVEEVAAASESLSIQADRLQELIAFFQTGMHPVSSPAVPVKPTKSPAAAGPVNGATGVKPAGKTAVKAKKPVKDKPEAADDQDWSEF